MTANVGLVMVVSNRPVRALKMPDVREKLANLGADVVANSPEEFERFVQAEIRKWAVVTKAAGIKAE